MKEIEVLNWKRQQIQEGYSLLELMLVIAIVGLLIGIGQPAYFNMLAKARRSEAVMNLKIFSTLAESYRAETGLFPEEVGSGPALSNSLAVFIIVLLPLLLDGNMSSGDTSNATSCHEDNAFGFKMSDCRSTRYSYNYMMTNNGASYIASAVEIGSKFNFTTLRSDTTSARRVFPHCSGTVPDAMILAGPDSSAYVAIDPTDPFICSSNDLIASYVRTMSP